MSSEIPEATPADDVIDKQERVEYVIDQRITAALAEGPVGLGDLMTWRRDGETDGDSGTFNYVEDVIQTVGESIVVDESETIVTAFGYPTPQVLVAGTYVVGFFVDSNDATYMNAQASFWDEEGESRVGPTDDVNGLYRYGQRGGSDDELDFQSVGGTQTAYLPAGTHIDISLQNDGVPWHMLLFIQKVG